MVDNGTMISVFRKSRTTGIVGHHFLLGEFPLSFNVLFVLRTLSMNKFFRIDLSRRPILYQHWKQSSHRNVIAIMEASPLEELIPVCKRRVPYRMNERIMAINGLDFVKFRVPRINTRRIEHLDRDAFKRLEPLLGFHRPRTGIVCGVFTTGNVVRTRLGSSVSIPCLQKDTEDFVMRIIGTISPSYTDTVALLGFAVLHTNQ